MRKSGVRCGMVVVLALAGSVWTNAAMAEEPLKVFVCAGQSNMLGKRSTVQELPEDLQAAQKNLIFVNDAWTPIVPGKTRKKGFGPEISFAKAISTHLNEPVGIIEYSVGGTDLAKQWSADHGELYPTLFERVKGAQAAKDIEIIGMLWMQGEADSKDLASSHQEIVQRLKKKIEAWHAVDGE